MNLFETKHRADKSPAKHLDDSFDFFDRSAIEEVALIREKLNKWFRKFPESGRRELANRFKEHFSAALYELFLHELFLRQGFKLYPHPELPDTRKRPDFLAVKGSNKIYIEATEASDTPDHEKALDKRLGVLYDAINQVKSADFLLKIDKIILKSHEAPSGKRVRKYLEDEIKKYDPDILTKEMEQLGRKASELIQYEDDRLTMHGSLIPKVASQRNVKGRFIGMYPSYIVFGGSENSIKKSVEKKATRYGKLDRPYIICVNSTSKKMTGQYDVRNALFGPLKSSWSEDPNNRDEKLIRDDGGLFQNEHGPLYTRVSAILVTNVHPGNLSNPLHWLVKHPYAKKELDFSIFDLSYTHVDKGVIKVQEVKSIKEVLNVEEST